VSAAAYDVCGEQHGELLRDQVRVSAAAYDVCGDKDANAGKRGPAPPPRLGRAYSADRVSTNER
jgi:hypothetical protein